MTAVTDRSMTTQPDRMKVTTLGEVCTFKYGRSLAAKDRSGSGYPVYGSNGVVGFHDAVQTDGPAIVIGRKGSYGEVNFSSGACWPIDTTYFIDRTCTDLNLGWLKHLLPTLGLNTMNRSAAVPGLNREDAYRVRIAVPSSSEQRGIAAILDKAEELRTKRRQALTHLDSLSAAYVELLQSEEEWPRRAFGELCSRVTVGVVVKPASHYVSDGIPALRSLNVRAGGLDMANLVHFSETSHTGLLRKSQLRSGDVVTVRTGNAGTSAVVPVDVGPLNAIDLIISTPLADLMTPEYAVAFLNSDAGRRMVLGESRGQIQQHFNVKSLQMASIPVPPIEIQQELGNRLAQVNSVRHSQLSQLAELDALLASLQHSAFEGGF